MTPTTIGPMPKPTNRIIDIETIPNLDVLPKMPDPDVKYGNTKDAEKRAAIDIEAKRKQQDKMALSPLTGRICAFCCIEETQDRHGNYNPMWMDWKLLIGVPHDIPIPGFGGRTVNVLRLFLHPQKISGITIRKRAQVFCP